MLLYVDPHLFTTKQRSEHYARNLASIHLLTRNTFALH